MARNKAKNSNTLWTSRVFASLTKASADAIVDVMDYSVVQPDTSVLHQGDSAENLYLIVTGACDVVLVLVV